MPTRALINDVLKFVLIYSQHLMSNSDAVRERGDPCAYRDLRSEEGVTLRQAQGNFSGGETKTGGSRSPAESEKSQPRI